MVRSYKCPGCGASLKYEEGTASLECPYCGRRVSVEEAVRKALEEEETPDESRPDSGASFQTAESEKKSEGTDDAGDGTRIFHCESCGGQLVTDRYTAATICPYCGSPSVIPGRLEGKRRPKLVIPFSIDREQAKEIFRKWTRSGILTPRAFSRVSALDGIRGLYVPYWLFHIFSAAQIEASATRTRTEIRGKYEYVYTDHFKLIRETENRYKRIPADASAEMPDDIMERLEPFDYSKIRNFEIPYLSGFYAEYSNFDPSALEPRVIQRASDAIYEQTMSTMNGFSSVNVMKSNIRSDKEKEEYAMFPIWVLQYRYRGKNWPLYLNGETGRKIGTLPVSPLRAAILFAASSAGIMLLTALIWQILL